MQVPGKDDVTGEPLVQRDDDKPEAVRARLQDFCFLVFCRNRFCPASCGLIDIVARIMIAKPVPCWSIMECQPQLVGLLPPQVEGVSEPQLV